MRKNTQSPKEYSEVHSGRFAFTADELQKRLPAGSRIADIGCHRLNMASLVREKGFEVTSYDVPELLEIPSTQALAKELGIDLVEIHRLDKGEFSRNVEDNHFDAILFAEILEHIAFNPLEMWSELFRIIRPGGLIFISTPNSLNLLQTLRGLAGILLRRGQGLSIPSLMSTVTYGHHWKEYSKRELIEYFSYLGLPRNKLEFQYINYSREVTPLALTVFNAVTAITPFWRRDIFLVVEIPETKPNVPPPPGIPAA